MYGIKVLSLKVQEILAEEDDYLKSSRSPSLSSCTNQ